MQRHRWANCRASTHWAGELTDITRAAPPVPKRDDGIGSFIPRGNRLAIVVLSAGLAVLTIPTMIAVARFSWSSEQGGHGPLVLATGLWLLWREIGSARVLREKGKLTLALPLIAGFLSVYILAHVTGILEIEGFALYFALLSGAYLLWGGAFLRKLWFPVVYLGFVFPPPDSWVAAITQPVKIAISASVVSLLYWLGYPIGSSGVTIQIAQYELLIAAACAGLNSLISLTAIGLFYVYMKHNADWRYSMLLFLAIVPVAVFANFIRVIILVLVTYYFGDAAAQGFMHDFAGLAMFVVALGTIVIVDSIASRIRKRLGSSTAHG